MEGESMDNTAGAQAGDIAGAQAGDIPAGRPSAGVIDITVRHPHALVPAGGRTVPTGPALPGLWGLPGLRMTAWLAERTADAQTRLLAAYRRTAESQWALTEAELGARRHLAELAVSAEEAEDDLRLRREVRQSGAAGARQILQADTETEKLLLEREALRRARRSGPAGGRPVPPPDGAGHAVEAHIGERQIEAMALRAVTRFGVLDPERSERSWREWREELGRRLPAYAAAEVIRRAEELRALAG